MEWLKQQGPWCPALLDYLERNHRQYDALIFFTYLYAPTVLGLAVAPGKSILVPTAHDEPAIRLGIYQDMFALPAGLVYNTDVERRFLNATFTDQRDRRGDRGVRRRPAAAVATRRTRQPEEDARATRTMPRRPSAVKRALGAGWPRGRGLQAPAQAARPDSRCTAAASRRARAAKS